MIWNNRKLITLALITAFALGIVSTYFGFVVPSRRERDDIQMFQLESDLITLDLLRRTDSNELLRRKERKLPIYAHMLTTELAEHPGAEYFLWRIRQYCETNRLTMDSELSQLLVRTPKDNPTPERLYYSEPDDKGSLKVLRDRVTRFGDTPSN